MCHVGRALQVGFHNAECLTVFREEWQAVSSVHDLAGELTLIAIAQAPQVDLDLALVDIDVKVIRHGAQPLILNDPLLALSALTSKHRIRLEAYGIAVLVEVQALLALGSGVALNEVPLASYRAPVRPLSLRLAGQSQEAVEIAQHWDTWFGMASHYTPHWEITDPYTAGGRKLNEKVASE